MVTSLTAAQLETYQQQGFVLIPGVFDCAELAVMDAEIDRLVEAQERGERTVGTPATGWVMSLGLASEKTAAFCADQRILDLVGGIVYPGIAIYSAKLVSKEPCDDTICHWHQDDAYYSKHSQSRTRMSVWIPLRDAVEVEQGALEVIPGSHERGLQPYAHQEGGTCNLGIQTSIDLENRVYCPVKAGSMLLFSSLLWHGSGGNRTTQRRRSFIVSYQEATVQGGNGDQWKILRPDTSLLAAKSA